MSALQSVGALAAAGPVGLEPNTGETITFWVCATLAVIGALGTVLSRNAVHSALFIAMTMINLAILYVAQDAPFLGMVQIIVYTGAVMMLFVFVLMVVGVDASDSLVETLKGQRVLAGVAFVGFLVMLGSALRLERDARQVGRTGLRQVADSGRTTSLRDAVGGTRARVRDRMRDRFRRGEGGRI